MKHCNKCDRDLPVDAFGKHKGQPDGHRNICKDCRNRAWREVPADHPSKVKAREAFRALPTDHPTRVKGRENQLERYYQDKRPFSARGRRRKLAKYGLTSASWDELFERQEQHCAICSTTVPGGRSNGGSDPNWHTDHDASIGLHAVRGILCAAHNIGLGHFRHDPELLRAAARYLEAQLPDVASLYADAAGRTLCALLRGDVVATQPYHFVGETKNLNTVGES